MFCDICQAAVSPTLSAGDESPLINWIDIGHTWLEKAEKSRLSPTYIHSPTPSAGDESPLINWIDFGHTRVGESRKGTAFPNLLIQTMLSLLMILTGPNPVGNTRYLDIF